MHNVDMNVAMAKRYNIQILILNFNKQNMMPAVGGHGHRWRMSFPQKKGVSKRGARRKLFMGINSNPLF